MPRRISRDEKNEEIYQRLCEGDDAVFNQLKDVFLMAACIGYKIGVRTPLSKRGKDFPWAVFNGDNDESIINSIALAECNDVRVLVDDRDDDCDDKVTIVEEYANTGIEYLRSEVLEKAGLPLDNMLLFINKQYSENNNEIYELDGLIV